MQDLKSSLPYNLIWLASYPKSGNTWFRIFLTNYFNNDDKPADIDNLERTPIASCRKSLDELYSIDSADLYVDEIDTRRPAMYDIWQIQKEMPFHKVHDAYTYLSNGTPLLGKPNGQAAIYLIRNPLDVAISFAHHSGHEDINKSIKHMGKDDFAFCDNEKRFTNQLRQKLLSWSNHVSSWMNSSLPKLFLRYEDMVANPMVEFTKAIQFLNLPNDVQRIKRAIAFSSFDTLKNQEKEKGFPEKAPKAKSFFRKGKTQDYLRILSSEQVTQIIQDHHNVMEKFNYSTSADA